MSCSGRMTHCSSLQFLEDWLLLKTTSIILGKDIILMGCKAPFGPVLLDAPFPPFLACLTLRCWTGTRVEFLVALGLGSSITFLSVIA